MGALGPLMQESAASYFIADASRGTIVLKSEALRCNSKGEKIDKLLS